MTSIKVPFQKQLENKAMVVTSQTKCLKLTHFRDFCRKIGQFLCNKTFLEYYLPKNLITGCFGVQTQMLVSLFDSVSVWRASVKNNLFYPNTFLFKNQMALQSDPDSYYRRSNRPNPDHVNYMRNMMVRFNRDYERRRRLDSIVMPKSEVRILAVEKTEFYTSENAKAHHTDLFELVQDKLATPVLRRGQPFYMAVEFDAAVDFEQDIIRFLFNFGPKPSVAKGTKAIIQVTRNDRVESDKWDARVHGVTGNIIAFQNSPENWTKIEVHHLEVKKCGLHKHINIPVISPVGLWNVSIRTGSTGNNAFKNFKCKEDIYILFNPWSEDDGVYMADESHRQEYVLNDTGKIWMGSYLKPKGRRWFYGQYDDVVLPVAVHLLEKSGLRYGERGNPILMARAISAVINSEDENGLIQGKWTEDFDDGVSPFAWTGSVAILEKYLQNNGSPVKYGQCWVFSGAAATICRALGIPARPVTNYVSAHDTNSSLTVEKYFTRDGTEIEGGPEGDCFDSCWNFHVWVDVWMKRPDLPPEFSGWQIIDSTPQELSDSKCSIVCDAYKCGPASVEAVRRGEVGYLYDTPFAFAEVNADIFHFQEDEESAWGFSRLNFDDKHVGKRIVTKKIGADDDDEKSNNDMEDITYSYKNPEGSDAERLAVFNAIRGVGKARLQYNVALPHEEDVKFELKELDTIQFGDPFDIVVDVLNLSNEPRTIHTTMAANSVFYTGITAHVLKKAAGKLILGPGQSEVMHITVTPESYLDKLVDHNMIKIYAIANVKETKQSWSKEDDFPFQKPSLRVAVTGELRIGQQCSAAFSFQNPINRPLVGCTISIEGPGLQRPKLSKFRDVGRYESVTFTEKFIPKRSGPRKIMAMFNSKHLTGITGSATVNIEEP